MALWDTADLLASAKRQLHRPTSDTPLTDTDWYHFMTRGQVYWLQRISAYAPEANYGAPELLTSADGGYTYTFAYEPVGHAEVRASRGGRLLHIGADWAPETDFVQEGRTLRVPNGKTRTFQGGPYARYVALPTGVINGGGVLVTMKPDFARELIVDYMLIEAAKRLKQDTSEWRQQMQDHWSGDPRDPADIGILGTLQTRFFGQGAVGQPHAGGAWWRSPDLGS